VRRAKMMKLTMSSRMRPFLWSSWGVITSMTAPGELKTKAIMYSSIVRLVQGWQARLLKYPTKNIYFFWDAKIFFWSRFFVIFHFWCDKLGLMSKSEFVLRKCIFLVLQYSSK
jgi:hypothetical protein